MTSILYLLLLQLFEEVSQVVSMLKVSTHSPSLLLSYRTLLPPLLKGLQSPLSAPLLTGVFTTLRHTAFTPITLSQPLPDLIAHITLRLQKPKCDLDPAWEEESLGESCFMMYTFLNLKLSRFFLIFKIYLVLRFAVPILRNNYVLIRCLV